MWDRTRLWVGLQSIIRHHAHTNTLTSGQFKIANLATGLFMGGGRKLENPEEIHTDMRTSGAQDQTTTYYRPFWIPYGGTNRIIWVDETAGWFEIFHLWKFVFLDYSFSGQLNMRQTCTERRSDLLKSSLAAGMNLQGVRHEFSGRYLCFNTPSITFVTDRHGHLSSRGDSGWRSRPLAPACVCELKNLLSLSSAKWCGHF